MDKKLAGKTSLITGSSKGIGQQIAMGLAELGSDIILHSRSEKNLKETKRLLESSNVKVFSVCGDIGTDDGIKEIIDGVNEICEGVDILYNNAAIGCNSVSMLERSMDSWNELIETNFYSIIKLCNAFIPHMIKNNYGRVINLSSGIKDKPELAAYALTKAMVDKYSQELAYELKDKNVLVNYLDPGWLKTDMGGPDAWFEVDTVLPGALVPAIFDENGPTGQFIEAQNYKYLK